MRNFSCFLTFISKDNIFAAQLYSAYANQNHERVYIIQSQHKHIKYHIFTLQVQPTYYYEFNNMSW